MTLKTKVRKIGNSYGIILPKEALHRLQVKEGDPLYLTEAPEGAFRVDAGEQDFDETMRIAEEGMKRYRNALRKLAE